MSRSVMVSVSMRDRNASRAVAIRGHLTFPQESGIPFRLARRVDLRRGSSSPRRFSRGLGWRRQRHPIRRKPAQPGWWECTAHRELINDTTNWANNPQVTRQPLGGKTPNDWVGHFTREFRARADERVDAVLEQVRVLQETPGQARGLSAFLSREAAAQLSAGLTAPGAIDVAAGAALVHLDCLGTSPSGPLSPCAPRVPERQGLQAPRRAPWGPPEVR